MSNIKDHLISSSIGSSQMSTSDEGRALWNIAQVFEQYLERGNFSPDFTSAVNLAISVCRSTAKTDKSLTLIEHVITILSSHLKQRPDGPTIPRAYTSGLTQAINRISALESGWPQQ